ncbi:DUF4442 domain-containing protein [bacterium]|nr:DUF4442 domain-containing protein [bacterium]
MSFYRKIKLTPQRAKRVFNWFPVYLFGRIKTTFIANDWKKMTVVVKRSFLNQNYVGTIFGGTLYAASDPQFMLMLLFILGEKNHIIWDKATTINYTKPATTDITFNFEVTDEMLAKIKSDLDETGKSHPVFNVQGIDKAGAVCCELVKTLSVKLKRKEG